MNKFLKRLLTVMLAVVCVLALVACADDNGSEKETGLFCKKIKGVYTIYKYVDDGAEKLDIAEKLAEMNITDTDIVIQEKAFNGNSNLKEIIVPSSVAQIQKGAFEGMKALESLTVPFVGYTAKGDVSVFDTAEDGDKSVDSERTVAHFFGDTEYVDGVLQTINFGTGESQSTACYVPLSLKKIIVKGDNNIPACAFNGLSKYVEIEIVGNVKIIGDYAFANTTQLAKISLPTTVEKINKGAFSNATALKEINLSELTNLTSIGEKAFENTALTSVVAPASLQTISDSAFKGCTAITEIKLNKGLKSIGNYAFMNCEKLAKIDSALVDAESVSLGNYAFAYCEDLVEANYDLGIYSNQPINAFIKAK